ncbi:hypothetical protein G7Y89_g6353 [Cudoniella acicularis]|uniref:Uncharacterized protein n=1 Tax=Cudoniella acicularis TaxID=354080 RepID=A0A8H4RKL3_9HELO|nr:hypothetical protein G7Y89_g6353 [Cudoniella acicularis]
MAYKELYACGFNAWNQLNFTTGINWAQPPRNERVFHSIVQHPDIEFVYASISAVLIRKGPDLLIAGHPDAFLTLIQSRRLQNCRHHIAIAGNGKVAAIGLDGSNSIINTYGSLNEYQINKPQTSVRVPTIKRIVANRTAFHALTSTGDVVSWGDLRFEALLGREPIEEYPGSHPSVVDDLAALPTGPIRKITSQGFMTAAITEGNDLYVWGEQPKPELRTGNGNGKGKENAQLKLFEELTGVPSAVDVLGYDVLDAAIGEGYALVLTTEGRLFVIGDNINCQLGLPEITHAAEWIEVIPSLQRGQRITAVWAGYKNSFLLVEQLF